MFLLTAAILLSAFPAKPQNRDLLSRQPDIQTNTPAKVNLRWSLRPGVSRYRLQIARDIGFVDMVFDRVVTGNEFQAGDLSPGKYFWRVAPLTSKLGQFSSALVIEVRAQAQLPIRQTASRSTQSPQLQTPPASPIAAGGGWRTAIGDVSFAISAHLRSRDRFDIVGINRDGLTFALDSMSGVSLWSTRRTQRNVIPLAPLTIRARSGLENIVVISGSTATKFEGTTGHELWHAALPAGASSGTVIETQRGSLLVVVDSSLSRMFILDGVDGNIIAQIRLPNRIVGAPVAFLDQTSPRVLLAYGNGRIEVRDEAGAVVRSGDAGSAATTAPLFIRGPREPLVIVGTRNGLTALNAAGLHPLGRVAINDDAPQGTLAAEDLNNDGSREIIMLTERGRATAVNATDGQIIWNADVGVGAGGIAFADVNEDGVTDVCITTGQAFASVLSGRDGSVLWKDTEDTGLVANHAVTLAPRSIVAVPFGRGALLIAADASHNALRAVEFPKASVKSKP